MDNLENKKQYNIRTDLALEARELVDEDKNVEIPGVKLTVRTNDKWDITISTIEVINEEGESKVNKPIGKYVTIECPHIKENDMDAHEEIIKVLSEQLKTITNITKDSKILVVGLGNSSVTPDALGPKVVSSLLVTRHLFEYVPDQIDDSVSSVCALSPGVMGQTGIETTEIIEGVVKKVKPDVVVAIDALASRKTERVNSTIQIADTGVNPGSGVGNRRMGLTKENLGVPVIAIGVPTVVDAATIVNDTIEYLVEAIKEQKADSPLITEHLKGFSEEEKYMLIREVLNPYVGDLYVTPKDVDAVIERIANIISNALNISIHQGLDKKDINRFMY